MVATEHFLLIGAVLLLTGILASKISARLGVPVLLLFLAIGMLAGSDGPGGIWFNSASVAQSTGVVALAVILFSGGLETDARAVSSVFWRGLSLATLGVAITAALTGAFASFVLGLPITEGLLIGSIVSSTDAAAVFAVLRSQRLGLKYRLQPLLEFESGSNDPMAVFLTVALTRLMAEPSVTALELVPMFLEQMLIGGALGYGIGRGAIAVFNRVHLETEGLYPALLVGVVFFTYGITATLGGSGFLAVYVTGIVLGNSEFLHKRSLIRFTDGVSWLMQITMFLILGLLVFPSQLPEVALPAGIIALFLAFVARPVSVFVGLALAKLGRRQKTLVSWVGLRGAVPIVLATFPMMAGLPRADLYFNVVFFVVLLSVLLQGTTIATAARWLRLQAPSVFRPKSPIDFVPAKRGTSEMMEIVITPDSPVAYKRLVDAGLPKTGLVILLTRGEDYLVPRGDTELRPGDLLLMLAETESESLIRQKLEGVKTESE